MLPALTKCVRAKATRSRRLRPRTRCRPTKSHDLTELLQTSSCKPARKLSCPVLHRRLQDHGGDSYFLISKNTRRSSPLRRLASALHFEARLLALGRRHNKALATLELREFDSVLTLRCSSARNPPLFTALTPIWSMLKSILRRSETKPTRRQR